MKKIALFILIAIGFSFSWAKDMKINNTVPSIKLKDLNGKEVDLKDYANKGKITIIDFWATWCAPCKKEIENINDNLADWKKKYDLNMVAISIDDARNSMKVKPYVDGKKWACDVLLDVNGDTQRGLNFQNVPYTILLDKQGNIVYKHAGYTEGDEFELENQIKKIK